MGSLIIGGKEVHDFGPKFKNWHETGWDATVEGCVQTMNACNGLLPYGQPPANNGIRRYALRPSLRRLGDPKNPPKFDAVRAVIKKFVLHHDGVDSAKSCWNVLQNERGLS